MNSRLITSPGFTTFLNCLDGDFMKGEMSFAPLQEDGTPDLSRRLDLLAGENRAALQHLAKTIVDDGKASAGILFVRSDDIWECSYSPQLSAIRFDHKAGSRRLWDQKYISYGYDDAPNSHISLAHSSLEKYTEMIFDTSETLTSFRRRLKFHGLGVVSLKHFLDLPPNASPEMLRAGILKILNVPFEVAKEATDFHWLQRSLYGEVPKTYKPPYRRSDTEIYRWGGKHVEIEFKAWLTDKGYDETVDVIVELDPGNASAADYELRPEFRKLFDFATDDQLLLPDGTDEDSYHALTNGLYGKQGTFS